MTNRQTLLADKDRSIVQKMWEGFKMKLTMRKLSRALRFALVAGMLVAASPTFAQSATATSRGKASKQVQKSTEKNGQKASATELNAVSVTGSRLRQVDISTMQPVYTLTQQHLQQLGLATVGDILSHLTVQSTLTTDRQSITGGGSTLGGSFLNMRALGPQRVLVLVNGHRWARDTNGAVDLSTIPSAVIQRVEILKDGASAIYGSDAVSGVVNIITKKNYKGAEIHAYYGLNQHGGDDRTKESSLTMGAVGQRSSVMMNLSYTKQGAMFDSTREETRYPDGPRHPNLGFSSFSPLGKFEVLAPDGSVAKTYALNGKGQDAANIDNYHVYTGALSDKSNPNSNRLFRLPTEQYSLYVQGQYGINKHLKLHAVAMYSRRTANVTSGFAQLGTNSFKNGIPGLISANSLYNPTSQDVGFLRQFDGLPSEQNLDDKTQHLNVALKGWFTVGSHEWDWDTSVTYNKSTTNNVSHNIFNLDHSQKAIGPSFIDATGNPACGTPDNTIGGGCVPWNVLGGPGGLTPAVLKYVAVSNRVYAGSGETDYAAEINGGLFDIPTGGTVAASMGVQRRQLSGFRVPDALAAEGLTTAGSSTVEHGHFSVNAAYYEIGVPVLRDLPGAQQLTFDIAGRYSHYSNFGSTFNTKYSFGWKPIKDLLVRGTWSQAFRAPSIDNLYGGVQQFTIGLLDPCDAKFGAQFYGQKIHNACLDSLRKLGIADVNNFREVDVTGQPAATTNPLLPSPANYGSNPNLGPETATTRTLGIVYSPHYVDGLNVELDWFKINLLNSIGVIGPDTVVTQCYQGNTKFCTFDRNKSGQIINFHYGQANFGGQIVEGYDFGASYHFTAGAAGQFLLRTQAQYLVKDNSFANIGGGGLPIPHAGTGVWRLRDTTSIHWKYHRFGATWAVRYFSSLRENCMFLSECNMPNFISPRTGLSPQRRIGAIAYNDLTVHWDAPWNGRFQIGVHNILNRQPPIVYSRLNNSGSGPFQPQYDIDRYVFVDYRQKF